MRADDVRGFSLIEIVVVLGVLAILAGSLAPMVVQQISRDNRDRTAEQMVRLLEGISGNPLEGRFGYVGDMGAPPRAGARGLADLLRRGRQRAFRTDPASGIGQGWSGPYVMATGPLAEATTDAWRTPIRYTQSGGAVQLRSAGADRRFGSADDLVHPQTPMPTLGNLTISVLGVPRANPAAALALTGAEARVRLRSLRNGRLRDTDVAFGGAAFPVGRVSFGLHEVVVAGRGAWTGASGRRVVPVLPGNNAVTVTVAQP